MRRYITIAGTVIVTLIALILPATLATGANRDAQGEHELVVYYGTTACDGG